MLATTGKPGRLDIRALPRREVQRQDLAKFLVFVDTWSKEGGREPHAVKLFQKRLCGEYPNCLIVKGVVRGDWAFQKEMILE